MKFIYPLFFAALLLANEPFDDTINKEQNLSVFNTKVTQENTRATNNPKIRCRYVCDKKVYREQVISEAISFYKKQRDHSKNQSK